MNTRKSLVLHIATVTLFAVLIPVSLMSAAPNELEGTIERRQDILSKLDAALSAKDAAAITSARLEIEAIPPRTYVEKSSREIRDMKLQFWLTTLQKIDALNDKNFNPEDRPMRNLTPPKSKDGQGYGSGISPDSIQDTDVRNEYKRMLVANAAKAERYAKQIALHNARWDWIRTVDFFRRDQYDDNLEDLNAIAQLVDLEIKDPALKKEVTELLAVKKK